MMGEDAADVKLVNEELFSNNPTILTNGETCNEQIRCACQRHDQE